MSKKSKIYKKHAEHIDPGVHYAISAAADLAKKTSSKNCDSTVELAVRLGVDSRKADQMVRGTVSLPHGTGKTVRVVVFAQGMPQMLRLKPEQSRSEPMTLSQK